MKDANLTERQQKWFASVRDSLERDSGKTLAEWVAIAHTCSETGHRARLKWFKEEHGLMQNRASHVLSEAFGSLSAWKEPLALVDALWVNRHARDIYEAIDALAMQLDGAVRTSRKGFGAWSRRVQFAALKPAGPGGRSAVLGLAVDPDAAPGLSPRGAAPWSDRLLSRVDLAAAGNVDAAIACLMRAAWERS